MKNKTKQEIKLIKAADLILKDIRKNAISKEHREREIDIDCAECKFRIFEGFLEWYKEIFEV